MATTEKLLDEITIKLTRQQKAQLVGLAEIKGMNASDAVRLMIDRFVSEHEREYLSMKIIFEDEE